MTMRRPLLALALLLLPLSSIAAFQGITGWASLDGALTKGVEVRVYLASGSGFGPLTGEKPIAKTSTDKEGAYKVKLEPGRYIVEGIRKNPPNRAVGVEPGDDYCLFPGSPVTVAREQATQAALSLTRAKAETRKKGQTSLLRGTITHKGARVPQCYLYLYTSPEGGFKGPSEVLQPVADGSFNLRVAPGKYYLVARKRAQGGSFGPIETGDLFNSYPLNPVTVGLDEEVEVELALIERLAQADADKSAYRGVKVLVVDALGKPLKGIYILAYPTASRNGPPAATAGPTHEDGATNIDAPPQAKYLRLRAAIGGPPEEGEKFHDAVLEKGKEVKIRYAPK